MPKKGQAYMMSARARGGMARGGMAMGGPAMSVGGDIG